VYISGGDCSVAKDFEEDQKRRKGFKNGIFGDMTHLKPLEHFYMRIQQWGNWFCTGHTWVCFDFLCHGERFLFWRNGLVEQIVVDSEEKK
jgi:hypothetical protein